MVRTIHIQLSRFMGPTTERARGKSFAWRRCHLPPRHFKGAHVHFRRFAPHHLAAPFVGVNAHGVRLLLGAGGYSPVLRLTADEMSLPYSPVPKSSPSGTRLYCRGGHFGSGSAPARSRTPQGRFPPARLLHPGGRCGTGMSSITSLTQAPAVQPRGLFRTSLTFLSSSATLYGFGKTSNPCIASRY